MRFLPGPQVYGVEVEMPFAPEDHSELGIFQLRYSIVPRVGAVIHEGQAYRLERRCRPHFYHVFRVGRQEARQAGRLVRWVCTCVVDG